MKIAIKGADFAMAQRAVACKKEVRKYLRYILLDATTSLAVATTGHIMVEAPFELLDDSPIESAMVRLDKVIPKSWEKGDLIIDTVEKTVVSRDSTISLPLLVQPPGEYPEPRHFPEYQRVSAHGSDFMLAPVERIMFDPVILQAVTKQYPVWFAFQGSCAKGTPRPIRVNVEGSNARITFMPRRYWSDS